MTVGIRALVGAISREELYQSFGWCHLNGAVGIRALVGAILREELVSELGCDVWVCLEKALVGSHVEDVSEQDQGRDLGPPIRGRKAKYFNVISSFEGRIANIELGMENTKGDVDLLEQCIEEVMGNIRGRSRTFKCKAHQFPWCHTRSSWLFKTRS